ncbi:GCN5-related N-acetyltransferase [Kribbella flavida DSM 17836]|uniref:GCN5-related N-acetyltransferase n=2 Tax=Kribbella flavida TaxID=182640 RepID=D2PYI8_KRIFD|nr:GCN5-related N-acetyltransferase [Kribbella flavida DSM 17836]
MEITDLRPDEYAEAARIWEASVRATHDFVTEADLDVFRPLVRAAFGQIEHLAGLRDGAGRLLGFAGAADGKLEMLFLAPASRGRGGGTLLLEHARGAFGVTAVDVNEQNHQAVGFYLHHGFQVVGRSAVDGTGKPYPLLHLRIAAQ